jgi:CheY-like chemotaxis protein
MTDVQRQRKPSRNGAASGLRGLRVLVVDDDLGVCRSLRDLLAAEGCEVQVATDGLRALEMIESQPPDIVVSDVVMPDLDGYELFMEVRRRGTIAGDPDDRLLLRPRSRHQAQPPRGARERHLQEAGRPGAPEAGDSRADRSRFRRRRLG